MKNFFILVMAGFLSLTIFDNCHASTINSNDLLSSTNPSSLNSDQNYSHNNDCATQNSCGHTCSCSHLTINFEKSSIHTFNIANFNSSTTNQPFIKETFSSDLFKPPLV